MSKAKIEIRADIPVIVFSCGGCRPCGHAEYEIIKELEAERAELIDALRELYDSSADCLGYELNVFISKLLQKHKGE